MALLGHFFAYDDQLGNGKDVAAYFEEEIRDLERLSRLMLNRAEGLMNSIVRVKAEVCFPSLRCLNLCGNDLSLRIEKNGHLLFKNNS
jgi:hypothetical protein